VDYKTTIIDEKMTSSDFILCIIQTDGGMKYVGQGLKWRSSPRLPRGWKKLTTAQRYASLAEGQWLESWLLNVSSIVVMQREIVYYCLSSYAITKQNFTINEDANNVENS
jgi:hypothetical protein